MRIIGPAFQAARNKHEPRFSLPDTVADFYRAHEDDFSPSPVSFLDIGRRQVIHPDAAEAERIRQYVLGDPAAEKVRENIAMYIAAKSSAVCYDDNHRPFVLLYTNKDRVNLLGGNATSEQNMHFITHHEIAHALHSGPAGTLSECISDVNGILQHFQFYGQNSVAMDDLPLSRAVSVLLGEKEKADMTHFTSPVVEKALALGRRMDIAGLDLREVFYVARAVAHEYMPSGQKLDDLQGYAEYMREIIHERGFHTKGLHRLMHKALKFDGGQHDNYKWTAVVAQGLLDGKIQHADGAPVAMSQNYRDQARVKLAVKMAEYEQDPLRLELSAYVDKYKKSPLVRAPRAP